MTDQWNQIWISVFSVIFVVILCGNLLTIFAIARSKKLSSIISNQFISSLAFSDLFVGLYIPYHVYFHFYSDDLGDEELYCILLFIVPVFACSHSILKLLTIAADRYIAIVYPLHYKRYMTRKVVLTLIIIIWCITILWSSIPIYYNNWDAKKNCENFEFLPTIYFQYMLTPLFGASWLTMLVVYIKIWKEATRHARRLKMTNRYLDGDINDSKSLQVVMLTLGCFSICWMPYFIVTTYFRITGTSTKFSLLYEIAFTMAVCNSGMNPVIYAWKNSNFREAFRCLLTCRSPNAATKKLNYITNHIPSKKSSMAIGQDNGGAQTDIELEIDSQTPKDYDEHECSVSTEMTTVNTLSWT